MTTERCRPPVQPNARPRRAFFSSSYLGSAKRHEHAALVIDRRLDAARLLEWVPVARLAVAAEQDLVGRVEEEHVRLRPVARERVERGARFGEERAAPRVDHEGHALVAAFP